jgi:hypothetical protein
MTEQQPNIPHVDASTPPGRLHQICEQVAVPNFDWINQPLIAVVDGLAQAAHVQAAPNQQHPHG